MLRKENKDPAPDKESSEDKKKNLSVKWNRRTEKKGSEKVKENRALQNSDVEKV